MNIFRGLSKSVAVVSASAVLGSTAALTGAVLSGPASAAQIDTSSRAAFIRSVAPLAQEGQRAYRVPASVAIAQAILESGWGKSTLTTRGNAFFGIKCSKVMGPYATGCINMRTREVFNGTPTFIVDGFRTYSNPVDSFKDHGRFLTVNSRYAKAFNYPNDPKRFIAEVHRAGYATDPTYTSMVFQLMEQNNLYRYDNLPAITKSEPSEPPKPTAAAVTATATPTPSSSPTPTASQTPTASPTPSASPTPTVSPTPSTSPTPTVSPTPSTSPTPKSSATPAVSETAKPTATPTVSQTAKASPTPKATATPTSPTPKATSVTPSVTPPASVTSRNTPATLRYAAPGVVDTPSASPSASPSPSGTPSVDPTWTSRHDSDAAHDHRAGKLKSQRHHDDHHHVNHHKSSESTSDYGAHSETLDPTTVRAQRSQDPEKSGALHPDGHKVTVHNVRPELVRSGGLANTGR